MGDDAVGAYVNDHFFCSYQKIGTFKIVNGAKVGGNVATYFCRSDGTVLHAIAGPMPAKQFLQEARWVIETRKSAITETRGDSYRYASYFRKAHTERYLEEFVPMDRQRVTKLPAQLPAHLSVQAQVHWLLGTRTAPKLADIYKIVYQDFLKEKVSNLPVQVR